MGTTLYDYVTDNGKYAPFGLPRSFELQGREAVFPDGRTVTFGDEPAVKCAEDSFLALAGEKVLLVEELPNATLAAYDPAQLDCDLPLFDDFEGWETDLGFAPGYVLTAFFLGGKLTLRPSPEPDIANPYVEPTKDEPEPAAAPQTFAVEIAPLPGRYYMLRFPETGELIFFDANRFLLYAIWRGRIVTGFVDVPPKDKPIPGD